MMVYVMKGCESLPLLLLVKIKYNNCRVQHGAQFSSHWHHPAMLLLLPRSHDIGDPSDICVFILLLNFTPSHHPSASNTNIITITFSTTKRMYSKT